MTKQNPTSEQKPSSVKYGFLNRYDRVCILLRPGDWDLIKEEHPRGASKWLREEVARHCDKLRSGAH